MPAIVKLKVIAARELPVMDRSSELTDAFVEIRLGQDASMKTEVRKKTLNPVWNSPWFQFDVKDEELQDEPLQLRVMDYDMYSSHDAIGRVYVPLNLLVDGNSSSPSVLDGWLPIFDTLHGVRGELHIIVSVEMIRDQHRFKESSSEVMLFSGPEVPSGYYVVAVKGFVKELVVNDDPEYQWIDKIRPPRTSNEARQRLFLKLSGELQRRIGVRAREAGGNSIIGYSQSFDLEGESGIVVRGIGTCVTLSASAPAPTYSPTLPEASSQHLQQGGSNMGNAVLDRGLEDVDGPSDSLTASADGATPIKHPRLRHTSSSASEVDAPPPSPSRAAGVGAETSSGSTAGFTFSLPLGRVNPGSSDFPFYTLSTLPSGFVRNIAGIVSARSVKLLDDINNPDQTETRDAWWQEVRSEVRSHSRTLGCNAVIGYSETTSICDGLCIFSALGTAAVVAVTRLSPLLVKKTSQIGIAPAEDDAMLTILSTAGGASDEESSQTMLDELPQCSPCHLTNFSTKSLVNKKKVTCAVCKSNLVPVVLLSTADIPAGLLVRGEGCLVQTRVCKAKKRAKGEENASSVSSILPFLEYSLHGRLMHKLKVKGMNAVFGVRIQVVAGDTMVIGIATGTAVYVEALPPPVNFSRQGKDSVMPLTNQLSDLQATLDDLQRYNRTKFSLDKSPTLPGVVSEAALLSKSREVSPELDGLESEAVFHKGKDQPCVVETDDQPLKIEDLTELRSEQNLPEGFHLSNLPNVPGLAGKLSDDSKLVVVVHKQILDSKLPKHMDEQFTHALNKVLQGLMFRVRRMHPCVLTNVTFEVDLPDDDEVQIQVVAMATKITHGGDDETPTKSASSRPASGQEQKPQAGESESTECLLFPMEGSDGGTVEKKALKKAFGSVASVYSREEAQVGPIPMTPMPQLPGQSCPAHLGIINLFLIKESTSVKEGGGLHSFLRTFISEAHAVVRAHVVALGGSVLLNYQLRQCIIIENTHKNQAQCLLNVTGDVRAMKSNRGKVTEPAHLQLDTLRPLELPESPSALNRKTSKVTPTASGLMSLHSTNNTPAHFQTTAC